jgi:hypothetical protein
MDLRGAFHLPADNPVLPLNIDLSTITAATDVALGFGTPLREIADLNFQSGPDANLPARLHLYNAALHLKYAVPVRSLVILLRPKADNRNLSGELTYISGDLPVRFRYEVIRLWKMPVEPFLKGGPGLLPLAPLCRLPPGRAVETAIREIVYEIDRRLLTLSDHAQAVRLMTAAFILTGLRIRKERLPELYDGVRIMSDMVAYDAYIMDERKSVLRKLGEKRFGRPGRRIEAALKAIEDLDRLERMIDVILDVTSWNELLAVQ